MKKSPFVIDFKPFNSLIIPIDKLANCLFNADLHDFGAIIEDKKLKIESPVKIIFPKDSNGTPINLVPFDKAILSFLGSALSAGNEYISYSKLFHLLGGGTDFSRAKDFKNAMDNALWKLRCTDLTIDLSAIVANRKKYANKLGVPYKPEDDHFSKVIWRGVLFPTEVVSATIKGGFSDSIIHFLGNSIIFEVADLKDQIARIDLNVFNVDIRTTIQTVSITYYLADRILKIKGSLNKDHVTKLSNFISFNTLINQCGFSNDKKNQRQTIRENVKNILECFKSKNFISNFEVLKKPDDFSFKIFF